MRQVEDTVQLNLKGLNFKRIEPFVHHMLKQHIFEFGNVCFYFRVNVVCTFSDIGMTELQQFPIERFRLLAFDFFTKK